MKMPETTHTDLAIGTLLNQFHSDSKFTVVVDDPDKDEWDVRERHYVDADRAGYCGYSDNTIAHGLSQSNAVWLADKLNELQDKRIAAWKARWNA